MSSPEPGYEDRYRRAAGAVFGRLRSEQGWSLREFAERVGDVAHTSLYAVERGESTPSFEVLGRVAATFGLDLSAMLLLIIDELDPEPSGLGRLMRDYRGLSEAQQAEVLSFIQFVHYRDRRD